MADTTNTITMDKEMLTEVMAQAMMRAQSGRLALPSRAAGEQSNIANRTEYYGLPLPTGNEVIAYQDFINDANNIIDGALHTIQNTLDNVSTTANNAADGVSAADTKIEELVKANVDNRVSELPQFMEDTNVMLENLQDDVAGITGFNLIFKDMSGGAVSSWKLGSNLVIIDSTIWNTDTEVTQEVVYYWSDVAITALKSKKDIVQTEGNIFNLKRTNVIYALGASIAFKDSAAPIQAWLGAYFNGIATIMTKLTAVASTGYTTALSVWPVRTKN